MDRRSCSKQIFIMVMNSDFIGSVLKKNYYKILRRRVKCLIFEDYYLIIKHGSERNAVREATVEVKAELGKNERLG